MSCRGAGSPGTGCTACAPSSTGSSAGSSPRGSSPTRYRRAPALGLDGLGRPAQGPAREPATGPSIDGHQPVVALDADLVRSYRNRGRQRRGLAGPQVKGGAVTWTLHLAVPDDAFAEGCLGMGAAVVDGVKAVVHPEHRHPPARHRETAALALGNLVPCGHPEVVGH